MAFNGQPESIHQVINNNRAFGPCAQKTYDTRSAVTCVWPLASLSSRPTRGQRACTCECGVPREGNLMRGWDKRQPVV